MNSTLIKEETLKEMKALSKRIENLQNKIKTLNTEIMCFGGTDNLYFEVRVKTDKLIELNDELITKIKQL